MYMYTHACKQVQLTTKLGKQVTNLVVMHFRYCKMITRYYCSGGHISLATDTAYYRTQNNIIQGMHMWMHSWKNYSRIWGPHSSPGLLLPSFHHV